MEKGVLWGKEGNQMGSGACVRTGPGELKNSSRKKVKSHVCEQNARGGSLHGNGRRDQESKEVQGNARIIARGAIFKGKRC